MLAVIGLPILLCGGCGLMTFGGNDQASDTTTTTRATTTYAAPAPASPTAARSTATATAPTTAPSQGRSSRCVEAPDQYVAVIDAAFNDSGHSLGEPWAIRDGDRWWIGGHIMEGERRVSSADVWVTDGPAVFALSGGARRNSMLVDGRDPLGLNAGDDIGLAVQSCVTGR
ncbi:hypothetical protein BOX37_23600 [Nocardia mangyaensis]|uniref:Uncharacterized protein n=1 Tax=Nocardia mangyaensis TaxID=2213200 RepID=A0A1J0VWP0_9NOCA|nr:hypothetical protein [Nocardia mangyaensis]APE36421.1 hypothetical protein BOX37_23600 [Nocardia mangyaensis]